MHYEGSILSVPHVTFFNDRLVSVLRKCGGTAASRAILINPTAAVEWFDSNALVALDGHHPRGWCLRNAWTSVIGGFRLIAPSN